MQKSVHLNSLKLIHVTDEERENKIWWAIKKLFRMNSY